MTDTVNLRTTDSNRSYARKLAFATLSAGAFGYVFWAARTDSSGSFWWQGSALIAGLATLLFTVEATKTQRHLKASKAVADPPSPRLTLPAPKPIAKEDNTMATTAADENSIDRERERLAKAGFNESEISQILIARESNMRGGSDGFAHGVLTGVLSNLTAVAGYLKGFVPGLKADVAKMLNPRMAFEARIEAAVGVVLKFAVVGVVAYLLYLEGALLRANVDRARAEACIQRQKNAINFSTMNELLSGSTRSLDAECKGL